MENCEIGETDIILIEEKIKNEFKIFNKELLEEERKNICANKECQKHEDLKSC